MVNFDNLVNIICGKKENFTQEHRVVNAIVFSGVLFSFAALVVHSMFLLEVAAILSLITCILTSIIFYISRIVGIYNKIIDIWYFLMLVILTANWITNGGSYGPSIYFYFSLFIELIIITKGKKRLYFISGIILNILFLLLLELNQEDLVKKYSSESQRIIDLLIFVFLNGILIVFIVTFIYKIYMQEKEKAKEIEEEKEELLKNIINMAYYNITTKLPNRKMFERFKMLYCKMKCDKK